MYAIRSYYGTLVALADLVEEFDARKARASVLDFSDQVDIAVRLADVPAVQQGERARYAAVLLDEFQDTSPPQLDLFARMFGPGHPVMAVGDPRITSYNVCYTKLLRVPNRKLERTPDLRARSRLALPQRCLD